MTRRGLQAVLLTVGVAGLFAPIAAVAASGPPTVDRIVSRAVAIPSAVTKTNWWYDDPSAIVAPVTAPPATPNQVPTGDLGVGYRNGPPSNPLPVPVAYPTAEADKQTFVTVDLGGVPAGSTITSFSLRVAVDRAGDPFSAATLLDPAGPPALIACPAVRAWDPGVGPSRYDSLPATDCTSAAKGVFDASTSTYTFSSAAIAQTWLDDTNNGLAILPDPATTASFTLSLLGASQMKVALAAEAPAAPVAPVRSSAAPSTAAPVVPTSTGAAPPMGSSGGGGFVPPVDVGGVTPPEQAAPAPVTAPQIAPGPAVQPPVTIAPVVSSTVTGRPWWAWILGAIGAASLLTSLSLSLGAPPPAPASARSHVPIRGAAR